jgi:hypothetical protein
MSRSDQGERSEDEDLGRDEGRDEGHERGTSRTNRRPLISRLSLSLPSICYRYKS